MVGAAKVAILPRFRRLAMRDVAEKAPGDLVTVADNEAEQLISRGLRKIIDIPVVGEEAVAENVSLLSALGEKACWLVDPIDGTSNFVAGRREYAVMAALLENAEPVAGWIVVPETKQVYVAKRGSGAYRNGIRIRRPASPADIKQLRGAAPTKRLDARERAELRTTGERFASLTQGTQSAGVNYTRLVEGDIDFVLYQRSQPWDHAAGTLLLTEAGGMSIRPDGTRYRITESPSNLLLNAADPACCRAVQAALWDN